MSGDRFQVLGGVSCMFGSLATNPIDVVKVRMQLQIGNGSGSKSPGAWQTTQLIIEQQGLRRGLYAGLTAALLREASYSTLRMGLYDPFKRTVTRFLTDSPAGLHTKVLAGGMSGAVGSALANPTDLIKIRMQTYPPAYSSTWQALRAIMFHEGLRGLYKGVTPSMIRAIILTASQLPTYDHTKYYLLGAGWLEEGYLLHTVSSMIAGLVCATATSPVDVIKSRYMQQQFSPTTGRGLVYSTPLNCFTQTISREGYQSLFKGWLPNWLRIGPHTIVTFVVYEQLRRLAGYSPI